MQESLGELPFSEAVAVWLGVHKPYVHARTFRDYQTYAKPLIDFFGVTLCKNIGLGEIRGFQRWRSSLYADQADLPFDSSISGSKFRHGAGPVRIKNEINGVLKPILKEIGAWHKIKQTGFRHLPVPDGDGAGVALTIEEREKLLKVAFSQDGWSLAAHCMRILHLTGSGFGELCRLRRRDVDLVKRTMRIVIGAKCKPRLRTVALVPRAFESMQWIVERWKKMGGNSGDDYLLPHRKYGFSRPMTGIYHTFVKVKLRCAALHPEMKDKLDLLRIYDGRVSAASLLLGNEKLSLPTIEKALGWRPNSKMRDRYHRKGIEQQREALLTLEETG